MNISSEEAVKILKDIRERYGEIDDPGRADINEIEALYEAAGVALHWAKEAEEFGEALELKQRLLTEAEHRIDLMSREFEQKQLSYFHENQELSAKYSHAASELKVCEELYAGENEKCGRLKKTIHELREQAGKLKEENSTYRAQVLELKAKLYDILTEKEAEARCPV